jgi:hypothetical protein
MQDTVINFEYFWGTIFILASILAHYFRKKLLKFYEKEVIEINQIKKESPDIKNNFRKNFNEHIVKAQISVLYFGRLLILLMGLIIFLKGIFK